MRAEAALRSRCVRGAGIGIGLRQREIGNALEIASCDAELSQGGRGAEPFRERLQAGGRTRSADRPLDAAQGPRHARRVVGQRVGQHHGVRGRVRQIEAAAQHMAQLVMQSHASLAESRAAQPCTVEAARAGRETVGLLGQQRQPGRESSNAFLGDQVQYRVAIVRIERLDGMRHRIEAAGHRDCHRQLQRELGIVDRDPRLHPGIAAGALEAVLGESEDRGHLRTRVGGRHGHHGMPGAKRNGLGQADGRASADGDRAVDINSATRAQASSTTSTGTCSWAPSKIPAKRSSSRPAAVSARARWLAVQSTSARPMPSPAVSSASRRPRLPAPNTTRVAFEPWAKSSVVMVLAVDAALSSEDEAGSASSRGGMRMCLVKVSVRFKWQGSCIACGRVASAWDGAWTRLKPW